MNTSMDTGTVFFAGRNHLREHPRNMRRFYPQAILTEMATSLVAVSNQNGNTCGNLQSLLVVSAPDAPAPIFRTEPKSGRTILVEGTLHVVDGNVRYRAGAILKAQCPPYKCELIAANAVEQLLAMTISNSLRYDPDPISEALHYKRLQDEEGLSYTKIAELTGRAHQTIVNRLPLLELDEPIQALIAEGKLHSDIRVTRALLSITDSRARIRLAERMAGEGMSIKAIVEACASVNQGLAARSRDRELQRHPLPMVGNAEQQAGKRVEEVQAPEPIPWETVRESAYLMCANCDIKQRQLEHIAEPAWTQIAHVAGQVCNNCNVRDVAGACRACPGVEFLKRLILEIESGKRMAVPLTANENGHGASASVGR